MRNRPCPDCGDEISLYARAHSCGWREVATTAPAISDTMRWRCSWVHAGDRCRNIGGLGGHVDGGNKLAGPFFCTGHFGCIDMDAGAKILRDSSADCGGDYSGAGIAAAAVRRFAAGAPTSADLTSQQWYNVCKFWPTIAKRCARPFADVGPDNPLDAASRMGPLMVHAQRKAVAADEQREREALQAESA